MGWNHQVVDGGLTIKELRVDVTSWSKDDWFSFALWIIWPSKKEEVKTRSLDLYFEGFWVVSPVSNNPEWRVGRLKRKINIKFAPKNGCLEWYHRFLSGRFWPIFRCNQAAKMSFGESNQPMIHVILGGWCFTPLDNEHRCVGKKNDLPTKTSPFLGFKSREIFPGFSIPVCRYTYNLNIQCSYKAIWSSTC